MPSMEELEDDRRSSGLDARREERSKPEITTQKSWIMDLGKMGDIEFLTRVQEGSSHRLGERFTPIIKKMEMLEDMEKVEDAIHAADGDPDRILKLKHDDWSEHDKAVYEAGRLVGVMDQVAGNSEMQKKKAELDAMKEKAKEQEATYFESRRKEKKEWDLFWQYRKSTWYSKIWPMLTLVFICLLEWGSLFYWVVMNTTFREIVLEESVSLLPVIKGKPNILSLIMWIGLVVLIIQRILQKKEAHPWIWMIPTFLVPYGLLHSAWILHHFSFGGGLVTLGLFVVVATVDLLLPRTIDDGKESVLRKYFHGYKVPFDVA